MIDAILLGFKLSLRLALGSGGSFVIAALIPEEEGFLKAASAVTGWALAIACIWVLVKAVRFLYTKIEEKDKIISSLYQAAADRSDKQRDDMLAELQKLHASQQTGTITTTNPSP